MTLKQLKKELDEINTEVLGNEEVYFRFSPKGKIRPQEVLCPIKQVLCQPEYIELI